jgi:DNA repair protein RAD5
MPSTKMKALMRYLRRDVLKRGRKVVVFSQFVSFLNILEEMTKTDGSIPYRVLHGGHSIEQRRNAVDWLSEDDAFAPRLEKSIPGAADDSDEISEDEMRQTKVGKVLFVSLKAGGVGLNLVAARNVYLLDLWFNPAVEDQALDRVSRLTQTKKVRAYKLVVKNSMDSKILEIQQRKSSIIDSALGNGTDGNLNAQAKASLSLDDLKHLFKPRDSQ